ncbi:MAG: ABC transporter permease [Anaerovoracaceae bacterium]
MKDKKKWLISPGVLTLFIFAIAPLFTMLYYSFQSDTGGTGFTFENYIHFFEKGFYLKLTGRTIINSLSVTLISLVIAYPLAYVMAKKLKGMRNVVLILIIIPFFTNQLVRIYSWIVFLQDGGIFNDFLISLGIIKGGLGLLYTRAAVIIGLVHAYFPYMVITIYLAMERIDNSLLEASRSLGASPPATFIKVTLPLSWPGVVSGVMLVFVPCLGSFVEPRILGGTGGAVIGTVIEAQFFQVYGWNFGASIAFLLLALVIVSMGIFNKMGKEKLI